METTGPACAVAGVYRGGLPLGVSAGCYTFNLGMALVTKTMEKTEEEPRSCAYTILSSCTLEGHLYQVTRCVDTDYERLLQIVYQVDKTFETLRVKIPSHDQQPLIFIRPVFVTRCQVRKSLATSHKALKASTDNRWCQLSRLPPAGRSKKRGDDNHVLLSCNWLSRPL